MARPRKKIDRRQVQKLAEIGCTYEEIAIVLECSTKLLQRRFVHVISEGRERSKVSLRRWQFQAAAKGNASLLIWLGKQYLDQKDKSELSGPNGGPIEHEYERVPDEKLDAEIERLKAAVQGSAAPIRHEATASSAPEGEDTPERQGTVN